MEYFLPSGIYIDAETCTHEQYSIISKSIVAMSVLATAGRWAIHARKPFRPNNPFNYFFGSKPDPQTINHVDTLLNAIIAYAAGDHGRGDPIRITCQDEGNVCLRRLPDGTFPIAYAYSSNTFIAVCSDFYVYPLNVIACTAEPVWTPFNGWVPGIGAETTASILLHEFAHAYSKLDIVDHAYGTVASGQLALQADPKRPPLKNADSYALSSGWALGAGYGLPEDGPHQKPCPEMFLPETARDAKAIDYDLGHLPGVLPDDLDLDHFLGDNPIEVHWHDPDSDATYPTVGQDAIPDVPGDLPDDLDFDSIFGDDPSDVQWQQQPPGVPQPQHPPSTAAFNWDDLESVSLDLAHLGLPDETMDSADSGGSSGSRPGR